MRRKIKFLRKLRKETKSFRQNWKKKYNDKTITTSYQANLLINLTRENNQMKFNG